MLYCKAKNFFISSPPKDKKPEPANGQADSDKQKGKSTKNKDKKPGKSGKMKQAKSEELASKAGKDDINEENEIVVGKLAEVSRAENLKDLLLRNLRFTDDIRKFKCTKNILFFKKKLSLSINNVVKT